MKPPIPDEAVEKGLTACIPVFATRDSDARHVEAILSAAAPVLYERWEAEAVARVEELGGRPKTGESANISAVWNDAIDHSVAAVRAIRTGGSDEQRLS